VDSSIDSFGIDLARICGSVVSVRVARYPAHSAIPQIEQNAKIAVHPELSPKAGQTINIKHSIEIKDIIHIAI
jgi:hypothetical protein